MNQTSHDAAEFKAATETRFRIEVPRIPLTEFDVRAYGAKGDGAAKDTAAIQDAVDDASAKGGGTVVVPAGAYLSGTIVLRGRIRLRLEKGAVLLGSLDVDDYRRSDRWPALLLAADAEDIAVEGGGALDGRGRELAVTMADLSLAGKRPELRYSEHHGRVAEADRPQLLEFRRCVRVAVSGISFKDSASWVQTYSLCRDLSIRGVRVDSDAFWNNDGIDVDDCRNVLVEDCDVDSADDGICLKSEVASAGCENIVIRRCRVRSSASAVKFGTASYGGFRNIAVRDLSVRDTFRSAIALESVDGGKMEDIDVSGIWAVNTGNALFIRLGKRNRSGEVGTARGIRIRGMRVQVPFGRPDAAYEVRGPDLPFFHNPIPSSIVGLPGAPVRDVVLEDIEILYPGRANKAMGCIAPHRVSSVPEREAEYPEFSMFGDLPAWGLYLRHIRGLRIRDLRLCHAEPDFRPALVVDDVESLSAEDVHLPADAAFPRWVLRSVREARLREERSAALETEGCAGITFE